MAITVPTTENLEHSAWLLVKLQRSVFETCTFAELPKGLVEAVNTLIRSARASRISVI